MFRLCVLPLSQGSESIMFIIICFLHRLFNPCTAGDTIALAFNTVGQHRLKTEDVGVKSKILEILRTPKKYP